MHRNYQQKYLLSVFLNHPVDNVCKQIARLYMRNCDIRHRNFDYKAKYSFMDRNEKIKKTRNTKVFCR